MKKYLLLLLPVLMLLLVGCVQNLPQMKLEHRLLPADTKLQNKGNLLINSVKDERDAIERIPTIVSETVILSGQTIPPTTDYVKETIRQEMNESGLFTVIDTTPFTENTIDLSDKQSAEDTFELNVTLKSARVKKHSSALNYIIGCPIGGVMGFTAATKPKTTIAIALLLLPVSYALAAVIPDTYKANIIMDAELTKGGNLVYKDVISYQTAKKQSQLGSTDSKSNKGSVMLDSGFTIVIRDMISRLNAKL